MSYLPVYPGMTGKKELYNKSKYYDQYSIELLGTAKDISEQISFVNPNPDPYLNADAILSNFANARVYSDYSEYMDETLKIINNELIGSNSNIKVDTWETKISQQQTVVDRRAYFIWQLGLNNIYQKFDINNIRKLKVLMFNKKCYGKHPYLFSDISALANGWVDLNYNIDEDDNNNNREYSVISASDYIFGYNNKVVIQSTLDGLGTSIAGDANYISNIGSI
jgi:hypothetical protein